MKKSSIMLPSLFLIFFFITSFFLNVGVAFVSDKSLFLETSKLNDQQSADNMLTNFLVTVIGADTVVSGGEYKLEVKIHNLTGSTADSLKLIIHAPNELKLLEGKDTLYTFFRSFSAADDSEYVSYDVDTNNDDGLNPRQKLRRLIVNLSELHPTIGVDAQPFFHYTVNLRVDSIKTTWKLLFQIELYKGDNYIPGADALKEVTFIEYPDFQVEKISAETFAPGDTGWFTIRYISNKGDARNVWLHDDFPPNLIFIDSNPDTTVPDTLIPNRYSWYESLLVKDTRKIITIQFTNDFLRKDCLQPLAENTAKPIYRSNRGELRWGEISVPFGRVVNIKAEPDLMTNLSRPDTSGSLSPGARVSLHASVKNIGGSEVSTSFSAQFSYAELKNGVPQNKKIIGSIDFNPSQIYPLTCSQNDSLMGFIDWELPSTAGNYRLYIEVDSDSVIEELDDLWAAGKMAANDSTYLPNNIDSTDVFIGIENLKVNISQITLADTVIKDYPIVGGFPSYVLAYINVKDQNDNSVIGLADTSKWLKKNDIIQTLNVPVDSVWNQLLEFHRDDPNVPAMNDIYQTQPQFVITEVNDTTFQESSGEPLAVSLVMDYSGSMSPADIAGAEIAAISFINLLRAQDRVALIKFASTVDVVQNLTYDKNSLLNAINSPPTVSGGKAMLDAIYLGVSQLMGVNARKMVIVYTDGEENSSSRSLTEVISYAQSRGVAVYAIGYGSEVDEDYLENIARQTCGEFYLSEDWDEVSEIFKQITYTAMNYYVLAYTTTDPEKNGLWRTLKVNVNYLDMATSSDTAHYQPPVEGIDLWISESSFPDSTVREQSTGEVIAKYAMPGDTIKYLISYGNNGYQSADNSILVKYLPDSVAAVLNITPAPDATTDSTLTWNFNTIPSGDAGTISFDLVVPTTMPDFMIPLYDSARVSCPNEQIENLANNSVIDTVLVLPTQPIHLQVPPVITAFPKEIFALEPDTFQIAAETALNWWDIWITDPAGVIDKVNYAGQIDSFRNNRTPLMPDTFIVVPPFLNTIIPADSDSGVYRVCLAYMDYFGRDTLVVCDSFMVKSNGMRADLLPRLDKLEKSKWRSPNKPIEISGIIKNIGGTALTADDNFAVLFTYENLSLNPGNSIVIEKLFLAGPIPALGSDSLTFSPFMWMPPDTGIYKITMIVDCDSQIVESHEVGDPSYLYNNECSETVTVRYAPPDLNISHVLISGGIELYGEPIIPAYFPENIISYVNVFDQNSYPIHGLADSANWVSQGEQTNVNIQFDNLWQPMSEYYRDDANQPTDKDISSGIRATEVTETERGSLDFARIAAALIFDQSPEMASYLPEVKDAAQWFVDELASSDSALVIKFASSVELVEALTNDKQMLKNGIEASPSVGTGVALFDAVYEACNQLLLANGRRMIFLITSGGNNNSQHQMEETVEFALKTNTSVNILNCSVSGDTTLNALARLTGGKCLSYNEIGTFQSIFEEFIRRINNFYIFIHSSSDGTTNGEWRTIDFTLNYANSRIKDTRNYQAPLTGTDPWVSISSLPDSVGPTASFAKPGETFTYTITYGNNGYESCESCVIKSVIPDSVSFPVNIYPAASHITEDTLSWEIEKINPGEIKVISYEVTVNSTMPPYYFSLYDSVNIVCSGGDDIDLTNNCDIDTVFVYPGEWSPPIIKAYPTEVPVNSPVQFVIKTQTPLKTWNIWIEYPLSSARGIDKTEYNNLVEPNKILPLMPTAENDSLVIEPPFQNTKIWGETGKERQREIYRVYLDFLDWFDRQDTVSTTFAVVAEYMSSLDKNRYNPAEEELTIQFSLIKDERVRITVYNVAGEFVKKVFDKNVPAGKHQTSWNGTDKNGRQVGNDVYIILVEAGPLKEWHKVVVIR